jgi:hypothetical protein
MLNQPSPTKPDEHPPGDNRQPDPRVLAPPVDPDIISDSQFMDGVEQLRALRSFLMSQAVSSKSEGPMHFGILNRLRRGEKGEGRPPNEDEWGQFEVLTDRLYRDLDDGTRLRFLSGQIPGWVTETAIGLGIAALVALLAAVGLFSLFGGDSRPPVILAFYLIWLAALGSIGSISFLGMNALAVQSDLTFDITNKRLLIMRIVLGALFGIVLTVPFGFKSFVTFLDDLNKGGTDVSAGDALKSMLLLLPFILGFSAPLVIMILNQFVQAVQLFFGRKPSEPPAASLGTKPGSSGP